MTTPQKIIWAEGVLLGQQHFQHWDRYLEQQQKNYWLASAPFHWGIQTLLIDEEALLNGKFQIKKCSAIYPNGKYVSYDSAEDSPLSCELHNKSDQAISIYLCLPANQHVSGINGYSDPNHAPTWKAEYRKILDMYDPNREQEVLMGSLNLFLCTEQPHEACYTLKIAEVINMGNRRYQLVNAYIAPSLKIQTTTSLINLLSRMLELINVKNRLLTEQKNLLNGVNEFNQTQLRHALLLQALNNAYINLFHLQQHPQSHPQQLFLQLINLSSALCAFSQSITLSQLPAYQHEDLGGTLTKLEQLLQKLLDEAMPIYSEPLKLRRENEALYLVDHIETSLLEKHSFFIAVYFQAEDPQWIIQFAKQIKVGSAQAIDSIVTSALPGVRVIHMQRPPQRLSIKTGFEYFYLEPTGQFWEQVKRDRNLGIFVPLDFINANIDFMSLQETTGKS